MADQESPLKRQDERPCAYGCGEPVSIYDRSAWQAVTGWARRRDAGGVNHIALKSYRDEWAHDLCVSRAQSEVRRVGEAAGQSGLFDG